jgi:hypothetical protein
MKKEILSLFMGMGMLCTSLNGFAQEFKDHVSREFSLPNISSSGILYIYNITGFIKVEGYNGNKVLIEMDEKITADDNTILENGKKEFKLGFDQKADTIIAFIAAPYDSRPRRTWYYNDERNEIEYQFSVDYTVKVPFGMNLHISTVNDGKIIVNNVTGNLNVNNVNEEILINNAKGKTHAHTVNGDVTVSYISDPSEESSYYTVNGNIHASYTSNLSADLQFKSMHGDFYTDYTNAELLPATVTKLQEKKDGSTVYKLNAFTSVRFGKGGKLFKFETLNGNVYIKKQS